VIQIFYQKTIILLKVPLSEFTILSIVHSLLPLTHRNIDLKN